MTTCEKTMLPEELLVAILHRVGTDIRIVDDFRLAEIFNDAAKKFGPPFSQFAWHPRYRYSKRLSESLQAMDDGGSISRDNPATDYFSVTRHTAGSFGENLYNKLSPRDKQAVDEIVNGIKTAFTD